MLGLLDIARRTYNEIIDDINGENLRNAESLNAICFLLLWYCSYSVVIIFVEFCSLVAALCQLSVSM